MKSIRLFLLVSIISIIVLANFLAAIHGYQESMQEAENLFDSKLENIADILAVSTLSGQLSTRKIDNSILFKVTDSHNQLLFQSKIFNSNKEFKLEPVANKTYRNFNNYRWRVMSHFYVDSQRWVYVMEKQDVRYKLAESVILKSVYPIILAIPTIALLIFFVIKRGLNPVNQLAKNVHRKKASELSPILLNNVPNELSQLTLRINDLLHRLDSSLLREKRFASDAAHELRTPIAALNIQMKNLLDEKKSNLDSQESIKELGVGVKRMSHLVEQILILNRMSPELYIDQFKKINIVSLLKEIIAELYPLIEENHHDIELSVLNISNESISNLFILGDEFALQTLFKNLITNAIKYTPNGGVIKIEISEKISCVNIDIMDSGKGIIEAERKRIFERFYRIDGDRNQSEVAGCGLGLSIVKQVSDLHNACISMHDSSFMYINKKINSGLHVKVVFKKQVVD